MYVCMYVQFLLAAAVCMLCLVMQSFLLSLHDLISINTVNILSIVATVSEIVARKRKMQDRIIYRPNGEQENGKTGNDGLR